MLSGTHKMIGVATAESLSALVNFPVSQAHLVAGCVKPDFTLTSIRYSHSKEKSFEYVMQLIEGLAKARMRTDKEVRDYSGCLGGTLHYMADYFCWAHNDKHLRPILAHFAYEFTLHHESCRVDLAGQALLCARGIQSSPLTSVAALREYIEALHTEYLTMPPSLTTDIRYAISASTVVAHSIVNMTQAYGKIRIAA